LERNGTEFSEEVSGRVMFLSMRTEAGPPAKTPDQRTALDPPILKLLRNKIREDVVFSDFGEAKTRKRRREPGEIALGLAMTDERGWVCYKLCAAFW